ncbi:outer membrane esterase [Xenorhabdus stockiae]|uniref:Outer membrane esterase n=1 Tax=Xenorhabdus stockiae TaxID=351614 RepID=A0A2D0KQR0_9GAMM|nr:autotransporter domain-containing protein [Xenorhabdus stockiae]PHM65764.1 outer membrane esterase [Xenorhabdus stockiae]
MKKSFLFAPALLALSVSTIANAQSFSDFCVFGDSLSDEAFTTEKNSSYKYDLSKDLTDKKSTEHDPNNPKRDCINNPKGGATAIPIKLFTDGLFEEKNPKTATTQAQLDAYLAEHNNRFSPNKIYLHWIGGNDIKWALYNAMAIQNNSNELAIRRAPELILTESAEAAGNQINNMIDKGAGLIIVPNVPDLGTTPRLLEEVLVNGITTKIKNTLNEKGISQNIIDGAVLPALQNQLNDMLNKIHLEINQRIIPSGDGRDIALQQIFHKISQEIPTKAEIMVKQYEQILKMFGFDPKEFVLDPQQIEKELTEGYYKASYMATKYTNDFNNKVESIISTSNGNILRADIYGLLHEVIDSPLSYGFDNNLGYGCGFGIDADKCNSEQKSFDDSKQFIFGDNFHASTLAQKIITQYIVSTYIAPSQVMTLNQVNRTPVKGTRASLDGHLQQLRHTGNEQGKFGVFGSYTDNRHDSFTLGGDYQLTENFLLGALYSNNKFDRSSVSNFTYEGNGHVATGYALWNIFDNAWLSGDIHYARINYDSLTRSIQLGQANRKETGSTTGKQWGARLTANWDIPVTDIVTTSPIVQFSWDKGDVKGYRESGNNSSAMHFSDQNYTSKVGTLGWRVDTQLGRFNPYASIQFNHQFGDTQYKMRSAMNKSDKLSFVVDSSKQSKDWRQYTIGANANLFGNIHGFASVTRNEGSSQDPNYNFSLGVSSRF